MQQSFQPIIVHAHIPKTAGQSFGALLKESFGDRHFSFYHERPDHYFTVSSLEKIISDRPDLLSISSHGIRVFPKTLASRTALYVTFLRDPTQTFLSLIKFVRRAYEQFPRAVTRDWPENTPAMSIRELAAFHVRGLGRLSQLCPQTRYFVHPDNSPQLTGYNLWYSGFNCFRLAAKALDDFFLVGIVEEFQKSVALLRSKLLEYNIEFKYSQIPTVNESLIEDKELDWVSESDALGNKVLKSNFNDYRLYSRYLERLCAEYAVSVECERDNVGNQQASSAKQPDGGKESFFQNEVTRAIRQFGTWEYHRFNSRRLEHLDSLGLPLIGRKVWEVSAGIGDLTSFFLDRGCEVTITDVRPLLLEVLRDRYPYCPIKKVDLECPGIESEPAFEIVFCYGTLFHVEHPGRCLSFLSTRCADILLLETCVSFGEDYAINPTEENSEIYTESIHGVGSRPTRRYIFDELRKHFPFVYVTAEQPRHEQYPIDWATEPESGPLARTVFVASRTAQHNEKLLEAVPHQQLRH